MSYAEGTSVPVERSRGELSRILERHGASDFMTGEVDGKAQVLFKHGDRRIRFQVPLDQGEPVKKLTPARLEASYQQERRRLWRALVLTVKARFEAVESGVETLEQAFLAHVVVNGGKTFGELAIPELDSGARAVAGLLGPGREA
jgi:hypothetical protein